MHDFIMADDTELWDVIYGGPFVPMKTVSEGTVTIPKKKRNEYNDADRKAIEKNFREKKILVCGIGLDEYNCISVCQSAKEIWKDHYKTNTEKAVKRNQVPDRKFKRIDVADNMVKQALAAWGDSSNESEGEDD
ncbi:uncharacterized protein LOC107772570 [Nicotiana tabacum]|uniref:Uncharacterized protein LOC107772570 n=1 Tax=Nicotiana tabacum TaxID=4097 RepID=A0A1S3Y651_TOBAC|nr:PREDICTED: uncharacterized protein LOC107772570 [Nicotiana tabacum]